MKQLANDCCFGGEQRKYTHHSETLQCEMTFSIYLPPQSFILGTKVPVMYWLSGLTCTDDNFVQKAGAQRYAAEYGIAIVATDTSPRGGQVADDSGYDLGQGAGFYLNALEKPWSEHYHMYSYIVDELPQLLTENFTMLDVSRASISGHSMGGHGALTIGLKNAKRFHSISAFSPICAPTQCAWGQKALATYLGNHQQNWLAYDSCHLLRHTPLNEIVPILVDQGEADEFYPKQLQTGLLREVVVDRALTAVDIRLQAGYGHSYYFVASFIGEHVHFHAKYLKA